MPKVPCITTQYWYHASLFKLSAWHSGTFKCSPSITSTAALHTSARALKQFSNLSRPAQVPCMLRLTVLVGFLHDDQKH